jgi:hypothetical protein
MGGSIAQHDGKPCAIGHEFLEQLAGESGS